MYKVKFINTQNMHSVHEKFCGLLKIDFLTLPCNLHASFETTRNRNRMTKFCRRQQYTFRRAQTVEQQFFEKNLIGGIERVVAF